MTSDLFVVEAEPFRPDPVEPPRLSMSFLRAAEQCLRRAHHDREHPGPSRPDAVIGHVFHEAAAACGFAAVMAGRSTLTPAEAEAIARGVIRRPERTGDPGKDVVEPLPRESWSTVIDLVRRWAARAEFQPGEQFEVSSRLPFHGRIMSARIDRLHVDGERARLRDYKTGWADPASGPIPVQGEIYAWHVFQRHPEVWVVEYVEDHVRFGVEGGPWEVTRDELADTEAWMADTVERVANAYTEGGELPATPGSACSQWDGCPAAVTCPARKLLIPDSPVGSETEAVLQFQALLADEAAVTARKKALRAWIESTGQRAIVHDGQEFGYPPPTGDARPGSLDPDALAAAGVDVDRYRKPPSKPSFGRRRAK